MEGSRPQTSETCQAGYSISKPPTSPRAKGHGTQHPEYGPVSSNGVGAVDSCFGNETTRRNPFMKNGGAPIKCTAMIKKIIFNRLGPIE